MNERRLLVVKTGDTLRQGVVRAGDFEDWILEGMGLAPEGAEVVDVRVPGATLPAPASVAAVVVTGSISMVTDRLDWSERTAGWLREATQAGTPILGICYGHQLLARAMGGTVAKNPRGRELGTITARLCPAAKDDPLFGALAARHEQLRVHATHLESVVELPPGARLLAESDGDPHQAFALGDRAFGVQFHPEFDAATLRAYAAARHDALVGEGHDPAALRAAIHDTPVGTALLRRFRALFEACTR